MTSHNIKRINAYPLANAVPLPIPAVRVAPASNEGLRDKTNTNDVIESQSKPSSQSTVYAKEKLESQGYTAGLVESIQRSNDVFPLRIWVVDNSGSMNAADGHRLAQYSNNSLKLLNCTRWAEIQDTVKYHAQMAALLEAPTSFRLLNPTYGKEMFGVAERGPEHIQKDLEVALDTIEEVSPMGCTPLADRIREIGVTVESMKDQLYSKGQKVAIILATDGLPTNRHGHSDNRTQDEFTRALRSLEGLPLWVVIRLCTDEDKIVDFYNNIDSQLELSIDVLDDFQAEAFEVFEHNQWLNYALPLHRMREMGFYHKLFDLIDERSLTLDELRDFFRLLYGADVLDGLPDPQVDWEKFLDRIGQVTRDQKLQWNPIFKQMMPWVDIGRLDRKYNNLPTCSSCFR